MSEVFEAFALPLGFEAATPAPIDLSGSSPGAKIDFVAPPLDPASMTRLTERLLEAGEGLKQRRARDLADALGRVGQRFLDEDDPLRAKALDSVERSASVSRGMAVAILDGMAADWTADRLHGLLSAEFEVPGSLEGFVDQRTRRVMAHGPTLCVQIVAGSVAGVSVTALIRSLLVKAPTLIKPGLGDIVLPVLFARALRDVDPQLAEALAVVYWRGGDEELERSALNHAEVAVVYGSDETVRSLRALAPAAVRVIGYHHRVGVGIVGREALGVHAYGVAREVARTVAMFEQRGCVCPQLVYVEEGGEVDSRQFASRVADALRDVEAELPSAPLETSEAASLQQLRGSAEMWAASTDGEVFHGADAGAWTVIYEPDGRSVSGSAARCLRIRSVADAAGVARLLKPLARHLQSVGVAGLGDRAESIAHELGTAGASRVVPFSRLSFPPPWWLHDGRGSLQELVRWTELEAE